MASININNNSYVGRSIVITGNKVIIDGKDVTPDSKSIEIKVEGNINELKVDACEKVSVTGNVEKLSTQSGDVDVSGDVGSINTMSGDVDCGNVNGSISTMSGDIKHRKH